MVTQCKHNHVHNSLAPGWTKGLTFAQLQKVDPSHTLPIMRDFIREATRRFQWLIKVINAAIIDLDVLDIAEATERTQVVALRRFQVLELPDVEDVLASVREKQYAFPRSSQKVSAFMKWIDEMEQRSVLEVFRRPGAARGMEEAWSDVYIRHAYQKGVARGRAELKAAGYKIPSFDSDPTKDVSLAMNQPIHVDRLGLAFTRSFTDLEGITKAMDTQISRTLADGLAAGYGPMKIAKNITDRVDKIGLTRAKTLARTEVIRAHHKANVGEYRQAQAMGIKIVAEWSTAATPCPLCSSLATRDYYTIEEIEDLIPVHPNCRCVALPMPLDFASEEVQDAVNGCHGWLPDCSQIMHDVIPPRFLRANTLLQLLEQKACLTKKDRDKVKKATASHKPATAAVQQQALKNEMKLSKALRKAKQLKDNEPFDVIVGDPDDPLHLIEVKTIVRGKNNKITMHPSSLARKMEEWKKFPKAKVHTVVFDDRVGKMYYREELGSFRLSSMQEISMKDLKALMNDGIVPDTIDGVSGYLPFCLTDLSTITILAPKKCLTKADVAKVKKAVKKKTPVKVRDIPDWAKLGTVEEIGDAFEKHFGLKLKLDATDDYRYVQTAKEIGKTFDALPPGLLNKLNKDELRFNQVVFINKEIIYTRDGLACGGCFDAGEKVIALGNADYMRADVSLLGRHVVGQSIQGLVRHELGHPFYTTAFVDADTGVGKVVRRLWIRHCDSVGIDEAWFKKNVSIYAGTNLEEAFAECFSLWLHPKYGTGKIPKLPSVVEKFFLDNVPIERTRTTK